ncbi:hypothetical protein [Anaeromyxobacter soli]|uniref:hypothetical protein n=1 Tax=Anaeromyxobacter soli TaxID=2922725 RepID=UPI001FAF075A|nr:hypothetical protein [Anaeromyxobacter sp. SG29]
MSWNPSRLRGAAPGLAALVAILLLAAWARVANFPAVLGRGELAPQIDGDSSYHLHRVLETVKRFPRVPHFDPLMNWPEGGFCPWADGFDLSAAAFALAAGGADPARTRIAVALWPVLLGLLTVWATVRLARRVAPGPSWKSAALAAGVAAALLPEAVVHSRLGRIDHHVVEALAMTLLATWALARVPVRRGVVPPARAWFELEGAIVAALAVWVFSGSPIYVALATLPLAWAARKDGGIVGSGGPALLAAGALSALLSIPAVLDHGHLVSFKFPSLLQPALLGAAGLGLCAWAWIAAAEPGRRRARLVAAAAALGSAVAVVVAFQRGALLEVASGVQGWLFRRDPWLATVAEFKPLFGRLPTDETRWMQSYWSLGWAGFFLPLASLVVAVRLGKRPRIAALLYFTAALAALSLLQTRFSRVAVPFVAVTTGLAVTATCRQLGRRWPWLRASAVPSLLLLVFFVADPPTRLLVQLAPRVKPEPILEAAFNLRDLPLSSPDRGVLSNWTFGHQLEVQADVPVVVNGFGSYLDERAFWNAVDIFKGTPGDLDAYMVRNRIGAVVAGAATAGSEISGAGDANAFARGALNASYMRSAPLSPLLIAGSAVPGWDVPHLPHLMPRYASSAIVNGIAFPLPFLWTYERVRGAAVSGTAAAGARVIAELRFTENRRAHTYKAWTDAGRDGAWTLVLPFPSGMLRPGLRSEARWTVSSNGGRPVEFELPEDAVRTGATIALGDLPRT